MKDHVPITQQLDDSKERQRLYERTRDDLAISARSNSESYDRALFTLSSAFLGGSLAFIGQVVNLSTAIDKWMIYGAWVLFALTIVLTLVSLLYGLLTAQPLRDAARRYYMDRVEAAWTKSEEVQRNILWFSVACGVSFILAICSLVAFVFVNLTREPIMAQKPSAPKHEERAIPPSTFQKPSSPSPAGSGAAPQTPPKTPATQTEPKKQSSGSSAGVKEQGSR